MTRTLAVIDGDISPGFDTVTGREAVRQRVQQRLRLFQGEWFLDAGVGLPYLQGVLAQSSGGTLVGPIVEAGIRTVDGVTAVRDVVVQVDLATRHLRFSANVETLDGSTAIEGAI